MLADILHRVAEMDNTGEPRYSPRPSLAGPDRCLRQMVYLARGEEPERSMSGRLIHNLDDSSWHEELTADWIGRTAFTLHSRQMSVSLPGVLTWRAGRPAWRCRVCSKAAGREVLIPAADLHGHIDGVFTDLLGTDRLWEHKAINHFTFERYWEATTFPEDYFAQVALYLRGLQYINPDLREGVLLIKNKMTSGFLEYRVDYEAASDSLNITLLVRHTGEYQALNEVRPEIVRQAIEKFAAVEEHLRAGTLPVRPFEPDDWHCRYCPFQHGCWSTFPGEIEGLATDAELEEEEATRVRYYKELSAQIAEMEEEKERLRGEILRAMEAHGAKHARAGEYVVSLSAQERRSIDWEQVPVVTQRALDPYRRLSVSTTIRISKFKSPKTSPRGRKQDGTV